MSTHPKIDTVCIGVILVTILITVLFMNGSVLGIETILDEDAELLSGSVYFTANDLNGSWSTAKATEITLSGNSAKISGNGAYFYDGDIVITNGGSYLLSGTLTNGSVIVDAYNSSKVFVMFDGVDITCPDDAAVRIEQADKVFLTLAEGSENILTGGENYTQEAINARRSGTIFARDDLTINGSGALTVTSGYKHGIDANDELVITGGSIRIDAPEDALHVNDSIRMQGMSLTIAAGDDGIHCDGDILIAGGEILISECYEGIEGLTIDIQAGEITVFCRDDGFNANGETEVFRIPGFYESSEDASGIQALSVDDTWIHISGGSITVINDSARDADGLDSNGNILISGGSIRISMTNSGSNSALDCGSENGGVLVITGGDIVACGSYMMAEGFDATSTQCSVLYNIREGFEAGTKVSLEDTQGNALLTYEVPFSFSSVVFSCPEMETGETYTVVIGDSEEKITVDEVSASFGDVQSTMFGGSMNWGGMQSRQDQAEDPEGNGNQMGRMHQRHGMGLMSTPTDFDGEMTGMGEMPDIGQMPTPPDFDGEMPQMGEMPTPPDFDGEMPQMDEMPDTSSRTSAEADVQPSAGSNPQGTGQAGAEAASITDYTSETWLASGLCTIVLLAGILFVKGWKKNN